jgi:hypothetical protein
LCKRKEELLSSLDDTCFHETESEYLRKVTDFGFKSILVESFKNKDNIEERLHIMFHYDYSILLVWDTFTYGDDGSWARSGQSVPPPSRNGGKFYYNWIPNDKIENSVTSSGGFVGNGDKDQSFSIMFNKDLTPHILPKELRDKQPKFRNCTWDEFSAKDTEWNKEVKSYLADQETIKIWNGDHDCGEALKHNINKLLENGVLVKKWKKQPFLWLLHHMDTKEEGYNCEEINKQRIAKLPIEVQELIKGE